jgi:hypothetical protein
MKRLLTATTALAGCLALAGSASGASTVGGPLAGDPQPATSDCTGTSRCTLVQQTLASGQATVPSAGVIVRFHAKVKSYAYLRFRVDRGTFAFHEAATSVYRSPTELHYTVPGSGTQTFTEDVRIPVLAGDRIGVDGGGGSWHAVVPGSSALVGTFTDMFFFTWGGGTKVDFELLVNADVEADSDHDGYGDETQDCQPTDPARHEPCTTPPPGSKPPPTTKPVIPPPHVKLPRTKSFFVEHGAVSVETRCDVPPGQGVQCSGAHATYAGTGPGALGGLLSTGGGLFGQLAKAKKRPTSLKVGSARFRIAAGKHKLVKIPLNRRARSTLAKRGTLKVLLVTTLKGKNGKTYTTRRNVTLRVKKTAKKPRR